MFPWSSVSPHVPPHGVASLVSIRTSQFPSQLRVLLRLSEPGTFVLYIIMYVLPFRLLALLHLLLSQDAFTISPNGIHTTILACYQCCSSG